VTTPIRNVDDLKAIAQNLSGSYELVTSIHLSGTWAPLGSFNGVLDGRGHTISGIALPADPVGGLFSDIAGGTVRRLGLNGTLVGTTSTAYQGLLAGTFSAGLIEDVAAISTLPSTDRAGGIVGYISGGALRRCWSQPTNPGVQLARTGSLMGYIDTTADVDSTCYCLGKPNGSQGVRSKAVSLSESAARDPASFPALKASEWILVSGEYPRLRPVLPELNLRPSGLQWPANPFLN